MTGESERERADAILIEQFRALRRQIPFMYALTIVNALFLGFAIRGTVPASMSAGVPALLTAGALVRAFVWLRRRDENPSANVIRAYMKGTLVAAVVLSIAFGGWGLVLFEQADMIRRTCIALYTFIGVVSCSYCLQSLPRAGRLVVICGAMPITVRLLLSGSWFLAGLGMDLVFVAILLMRMLADNHRGFIEVLGSRADMAAEQQADADAGKAQRDGGRHAPHGRYQRGRQGHHGTQPGQHGQQQAAGRRQRKAVARLEQGMLRDGFHGSVLPGHPMEYRQPARGLVCLERTDVTWRDIGTLSRLPRPP